MGCLAGRGCAGRQCRLDPDKNAIIGKASPFFGELSGILQERWRNEAWPEGQQELQAILQVPPRISKGENYKGLPWVVLDYPRCFGRDDVLAVRTLFWWGHYFSVTLHLKGSYKEMFLPVIRDHLPLLGAAGFFIGVSTTNGGMSWGRIITVRSIRGRPVRWMPSWAGSIPGILGEMRSAPLEPGASFCCAYRDRYTGAES